MSALVCPLGELQLMEVFGKIMRVLMNGLDIFKVDYTAGIYLSLFSLDILIFELFL